MKVEKDGVFHKGAFYRVPYISISDTEGVVVAICPVKTQIELPGISVNVGRVEEAMDKVIQAALEGMQFSPGYVEMIK